jgi:hypothetical protein
MPGDDHADATVLLEPAHRSQPRLQPTWSASIRLLAASPTAPQGGGGLRQRHHPPSKIVQAWLASHPRVRVLHGARYSPHDNPVERSWGALKAHLANSPTPTKAGRIRQVHVLVRNAAPPKS